MRATTSVRPRCSGSSPSASRIAGAATFESSERRPIATPSANALLKEFRGIGDVGVDIFLREAQLAWSALYPFADARALAVARRLGLPDGPARLAALVHERDFPRLVASLVRVGLARQDDAVRARAGRP